MPPSRNSLPHVGHLGILVAFLLFGCTHIWNAGDLVEWVKDRAVEQGCQRDTIQLDDRYTETDQANVWRGTCRDAQGNAKSFDIAVDSVWKPSQPAS